MIVVFFDKFSSLCKDKGVSHSKAAESIGLNRTVVVKWKNGSIPSGNTLTKLAAYFNVPVDYLLDKKDASAEALPSADKLTPSQQKLIEYASDLTNEELQETLDFIGYLKAKRSN